MKRGDIVHIISSDKWSADRRGDECWAVLLDRWTTCEGAWTMNVIYKVKGPWPRTSNLAFKEDIISSDEVPDEVQVALMRYNLKGEAV